MAAPNCHCGHRVEAPAANELGVIEVDGTRHFCRENTDDDAPPVPQNGVFCHRCATRLLSSQITRYKAAIETHRLERVEFRRRLLATRLAVNNAEHHRGDDFSLSTTRALPDPNYIRQQVSQLRQTLDKLRSVSNELAIRVTSKTVENDERQERLELNFAKVDLARERLDSMRQFLLLTSEENSAADNAEEKKHAELSYRYTNSGGGLRDALLSGTRQIQTIRFHFALRVFEMHSIDVGEENSHLMIRKPTGGRNNSALIASGVGKIGGFPLPHAGPALYGVLPPGMLASSLRLVASLTNLLARCLGVVLPHPILVCSRECVRCGRLYDYNSDVICDAGGSCQVDDVLGGLCSSCVRDDLRDSSEYHELCDEHLSNSKYQSHGSKQDIKSSLLQNIPSKSSFLSFVGTSARKAMAIATGSAPPTSLEPLKTKSMNQNQSASYARATSPSAIARRINYASFAVLLESNESGAAEYVLNPPRWKEEKKHSNEDHESAGKFYKSQVFSNREEFHLAEEKFGTGLQLLQNDVIALCFRTGVDVSSLWPAESVLLNLYSLLCHCIHVLGLV
ncbi:hypothetical protein HJC23_003131 [Cyclotella cryptica]|uniref:Uncharacterized protein n=1 Tax=Cyclotella cryptica TaxID=29204 RepID=A0ABD3P3Z2_9STRA|eukprot:CCRYP_017533-RB/>CCRYP_017533-RB protein AED:0.00 eAED:0.00 QI:205/-1/1/1/-1/1/1/48/565